MPGITVGATTVLTERINRNGELVGHVKPGAATENPQILSWFYPAKVCFHTRSKTSAGQTLLCVWPHKAGVAAVPREGGGSVGLEDF